MTFYVELLTKIRHGSSGWHGSSDWYVAHRFLPCDTLDEARRMAIKVYKNKGYREISINGQNAQLDVGHPRFGIGITKSDKGGPAMGFVTQSVTGKWFWVSNQKYPTVKPINLDGSISKRK